MFQGIVGIRTWYPRERQNLAYDSKRGLHGSQELDKDSAGGGLEGQNLAYGSEWGLHGGGQELDEGSVGGGQREAGAWLMTVSGACTGARSWMKGVLGEDRRG